MPQKSSNQAVFSFYFFNNNLGFVESGHAAGLSIKDVLPEKAFTKDWVIEERVNFDKDFTLSIYRWEKPNSIFPYGF